MTPDANAAAWRPPAKRSRSRRATQIVAVGLMGLLLSSYLSSFVFLALNKADPRSASPLTLARYAYHYGDQAIIRQRLGLSLAAGLGVMLVSGLAVFLPRRRSLHGDARFATRREIRAAGLLGEQGIILGKLGNKCLMLAGQQGVALAAPPRAGKGTGVVIPNALNWPGSLVCIDIKRENWTITAGFRQQSGQACYLFDPFAEDGQTARWNPFSYVSRDPIRRINDLQRISDMLYPDPPNVDPFWTASARSLFLGIALYLFETPSLPKTIGEVLRQGMASDDEGFGHHWKRVIEGRGKGENPLSPECARALCDVIDLAPVTASSIRKTFTSRLDLWLNPMLDQATADNDFDLRDLRAKPISIYVGVNPDDLHRLRPVLNLFFQQAIGLQTRELPERNPRLKYQVMMLLDEFTALGRIPIIAEAISYLPGYNVRVVLVIQTPAQLREVYGMHNTETMLKSLAARVVFAPKDFNDAREISDELGYTTVKVKSQSRPRLDLGNGHGRRSRSENISEQRRALLLPQEVKEMGNDSALLFYEGLRPIRCEKLRYFEDARFRARLLPPPKLAAPVRQKSEAPSTLLPTSTLTSTESIAMVATPSSVSVPRERRAMEASTVREATLEDLERLESLTLEDFAVDLSQVQVPRAAEGWRLTATEIDLAADNFVASLER